jgi:membrane-associated phospholipid phosphatase
VEEYEVVMQYRRFCLLNLAMLISICMFPRQSALASDEIEKAGDAIQLLLPAIAYGATFYLDDSAGRAQFYRSFFTSLGVTYGLKNTIDKTRPNGSAQSFPSGHTSAAFQGAAFIHQRYGITYAVPAYVGAVFVGYSRVESDNHYVEDVVAGALIGTASSLYFTQPYKNVVIAPITNNRVYGLSISGQW